MSTESGSTQRPRSPPVANSTTQSPRPEGSGSPRFDPVIPKGDKILRRYATGIERALSSFDPTNQEWADYIAFLSRLLKALQAVRETSIIPHSSLISLRLAQCLNPNLPPGVHQKAIEVYSEIFSLLGTTKLGHDLSLFLPGLLPVLSFASLTVRPKLLELYEVYIAKLDDTSLRHALKSIILSLLPGIEDETSEDFDRVVDILDGLKHIFASQQDAQESLDSYFWQCLFLAIITNEPRRLGGLIYMTRRLPLCTNTISAQESDVKHEPGLLIRCFAVGLRDRNFLVQRGFLDLLVSHVPLHSALLSTIKQIDLDLLITAALSVVLRRDMSLNRRLFSWFLGPETPNGELANESVDTPTTASPEASRDSQLRYFHSFGSSRLQRCILEMFSKTSLQLAEQTTPFRIILALMDRSEIGGLLIPQIMMPALRFAFQCYRSSTQPMADEIMRSASLFFDAIESSLIWEQLIDELKNLFDPSRFSTDSMQSLRFLYFVITKFNIHEEEMLTIHIPRAYVTTMANLLELSSEAELLTDNFTNLSIEFASHLLSTIPDRGILHQEIRINSAGYNDTVAKVCKSSSTSSIAITKALLLYQASQLLLRALEKDKFRSVIGRITDMITAIMARPVGTADTDWATISVAAIKSWSTARQDESQFDEITSIIGLWSSAEDPPANTAMFLLAMQFYWKHLSLDNPKYHVEAVRMLWRLHKLLDQTGDIINLAVFVKQELLNDDHDALEQVMRFEVLWELTFHNQQPNRMERKASGQIRRQNSLTPAAADIDVLTAEMTLVQPLLLLLHRLENSQNAVKQHVTKWLHGLYTLEHAFSMLLRSIDVAKSAIEACSKSYHGSSRVNRVGQEHTAILHVHLRYTLQLLRVASKENLRFLTQRQFNSAIQTEKPISSSEFLVRYSMLILQDASYNGQTQLRLTVIELLKYFLHDIPSHYIDVSHLADFMLTLLTDMIDHGQDSLQRACLDLLALALTTQSLNNHAVSENKPDVPIVVVRSNTDDLLTPKFYTCVKSAINSPASRAILDEWIDTLAVVLPLHPQTIFSAMLPLVETLCKQITLIFNSVKTLANNYETRDVISTSHLPSLLQGLEMIVATAHANLNDPENETNNQKPNQRSQGSAIGRSFSQGPNRNSRLNNRLAVVLCIHDTVKICFDMWNWATYGIEGQDTDQTSIATTSFNAQRLRTRTRRLLENLLAVEGLECVEMLLSIWIKQRSIDGKASQHVFSILNVLNGSRPRNTIPILFNSLYSRTNLEVLDINRRSSMTRDLSAGEIVSFLLEYVSTLEDDALDEIWADCITFLRDILSNPLPHRQVLPPMLEFVTLLAEKIENTNFGDRVKMHRELGDIFSRLLTAIFTVRSGGVFDTTSNTKTKQIGDVLESFIEVIPKLHIVLDTNTKITTTINSITTNSANPIFHAKAFPENVRPSLLEVLVLGAAQAPDAKLWRKEVMDAFGDPRFFMSNLEIVTDKWQALLNKLVLGDANIMPDFLSRIAIPSTTTLMFGVGANNARIAADRLAQQNIRRVALLLLSADNDTFISSIPSIISKITEICTATLTSAPSSATRADIFILCRALFLSTSHIQLAGLWPLINSILTTTLLSLLPDSSQSQPPSFNNLTLYQACKLLDLFVVIQPDEFQLQEWIFLTNTIDAIYSTNSNNPAIIDEISHTLSIIQQQQLQQHGQQEDANGLEDRLQYLDIDKQMDGEIQPLRSPRLSSEKITLDIGDVKVMPKDDFVRIYLLPFLTGLSMVSYESTYSLSSVDFAACKKDVLYDIMDEKTIVT